MEDNEFDISNVRKQGILGNRGSGGIGYVALPIDVDRDVFIQQCLNLQQISMVTENFEFINNVPVDAEKMQYLRFPNDPTLLGSTLVWINIPKHNFPVVVAVLNPKDKVSKISDLNSYNLTRQHPNNQNINTSFKMLGESGKINITTQGDKESESILSIKIYNNAKKGQLNTYVQGSINTEVEDTVILKAVNGFEINVQDQQADSVLTTIKYTRNSGFSYVDEFGNQFILNKDGLTIVAPKINLGDNNLTENGVLGQQLSQLLNDLITQIQSITTFTMLGPSPILNASAFIPIINNINSILSQLVYLK